MKSLLKYHSLLVALIMLVAGCCLIACDDDNDEEYITDTQLSVLQDNRASLTYLLRNSTYGTVPGTYPREAKDLLNDAISTLDSVIERVRNGASLSESEFVAVVESVSRAIDEFKRQRLYNLSDEVRTYIENIMAMADRLRSMIADDSLWGNHKDQYPLSGKSLLESAAADLENYAERLNSGAIPDMTEEMYDEVMDKATATLEQVKATAWPDNSNITWNLYVDGNQGTYLDFGYSEDYVQFGAQDNQAFTIELWVNIEQYCNRPGEDNSTFLNTMTNDPYWSGWRAQDRVKGLMRTMVAHWEDDNYANPRQWEPGWKKSDNWNQNRWTHYAFLFRDKGLPGFDTPTDVKAYSMIDGSRNGEIIRVGEPWRTYIPDNSVANQIHMTGFCQMDKDGNRNEWWSGYIKKVRIWRTNRSEDDIYRSYLGAEQGVTADNPDLVDAWDFEVIGDAPQGHEYIGLKGHKVTIVGARFEWRETTAIPDNR